MRARNWAAVIAGACVLLAGCGGSPRPPSARALALRVPGCASPAAVAPPPQARAEVTCETGYASISVATFPTQSAGMSWLVSLGRQGGSECVQGHLWAAGIMADAMPTHPVDVRVARALGGRLVSTGFC